LTHKQPELEGVSRPLPLDRAAALSGARSLAGATSAVGATSTVGARRASAVEIQRAVAGEPATVRRWPAEWEPQAAVWFSWPHNQETWPGRFPLIADAFSAMVRAACQFVPVKVLAAGEWAAVAAKHLGSSDRIEIVDVATNDCWIRDYGPTFVVDGDEVVGIDWQYNAWGGKYPPWDDDAAAARKICQWGGIRCETSPMGLEGGAIEGDGTGRMLTTPSCVETATRNCGWTRGRIAEELNRRLGVTEIVWIDGGGLEGDDTDGHIDQLARFVDPGHVVCAVSADSSDPNYQGLQTNHKQLLAWAEQTTPRVTVHPLVIPPARRIGGARVPESYCNFLMLGNAAALVPTFGQSQHDGDAMGLLSDLMPGREIIGVDAYDFAWGLGAWHCASQQQPAGPRT